MLLTLSHFQLGRRSSSCPGWFEFPEIDLSENAGKGNHIKLDGSGTHRYIETKSRRTKAQHTIETFLVVSVELTGSDIDFEFLEFKKSSHKLAFYFFNRLNCIFFFFT